MISDWAPFRGTSDADEQGFLDSEAFTLRSNTDSIDVVCAKSSISTSFGNVLSVQKNWTCILMHELIHLTGGTTDVDSGYTSSAWYGIGPHAGYPVYDSIRPAQNWTYFAADCVAQRTDGQRSSTLLII